MTIVLAFDSFKDCISAAEACHAAAEGIRRWRPDAQITEIPLSDGGEGLVSCIQKSLHTHLITLRAHGPLMEPIDAKYALSEDGSIAFMEMAATSGLPLVPMEKRNPMLTTTYGVGEMLQDAARRGCKKIILGIGGSATCDAGRGMLQALRDAKADFASLPPITVACDVSNPLYGPDGAAYVYAPQKGATPEQVELLDNQLRIFAQETQDAGIAPAGLALTPGAGAAGGLGYALLAYLGAQLRSGIDIMLDIACFNDRIEGADLVITGEGKSDSQTLMGKLPHGVLKRCKARNIPVWLLSGAMDDSSHTLADHFTLAESINRNDARPLSLLLQPEVAKANLAATTEQLLRQYKQ